MGTSYHEWTLALQEGKGRGMGNALYLPHLTPFLFFMGDGEHGSQPLKYTVLFAASCCFLPFALLRHSFDRELSQR